MAIDFSKYGQSVEEVEGKQKTGFSEYGTPATPEPIKPKEEGVKGMKGVAVGVAKGALGTVKSFGQLGESIGQGILGGVKKLTGLPVTSERNYSEEALQKNSEKGGFLGKLLNEKNLEGKSTAEKIGKVTEFIGEVVGPAALAKTAVRGLKTLSYLKNTPETLSKLEEKAYSLGGKIKTSLSGSKKIIASETEERASKILNGKISGNVTKNPPIIQKEITKRGQEAEQFLTRNKLPVSAQEQADMFGKARKEMEKYATKTELRAYDEQMQTFLKQIPGRGGYTTDNFYKALKEFEQNVTSNLPRGKKALLGDSQGIGSARIRAAQDVRKVVRDMIGNKHPEFKEKMFDLASLYDVLDTALAKSRLLSGNSLSRFAENNPVLTNVAKFGAGIGVGRYLLGNKSGVDKSTYNPLE